ncbi:P27 family phage terminase small subunit [Mesorhizobium sp.]|uniref:P27 family phage terminase small subunit n=1 Tax=Mesorhizobium sp. TaxID=1871066 RepID=UPI0025D7581B|nr:P27 family phage terminase small subunit [Mesorhizobium sp.]
MKGRKAQPQLQAAKADPAKRSRRTNAQKAIDAIEQRAQLAKERAAQFAVGQADVVMPAFMSENPQYAGAAAVWRYHVDLLKQRNFWGAAFIGPFTGFCIYYDEFLAADREVKQKGWGVEGRSTSGGQRFWKNPAVEVRDHAFARVMELSTRYAFTPLDLYKLERESAAAAGGGNRPPANGGQLPLSEDESPSPSSVAASDDTFGPGAMTAFDGEPPPGHYN